MNKKTLITENAYGEDKSSLNYWKNNRNKFNDLYPSEKHFLYPALKLSKLVLDVGCAAGGSFNFCKEVNSSINYTGIDISKSLIDIAKKLYPKGTFIKYNGHQIIFKKDMFDLVFSIGVLHHLRHWRSMIKQSVQCSSNLIIFDVRLTPNNTIDNSQKYYQKIIFNNKLNSDVAIPYLVINIDSFVKFIEECFGSGNFRVESYGYYSKPTPLVNIPYKKVFMCCIKIEKNSKSPGIFVDFTD